MRNQKPGSGKAAVIMGGIGVILSFVPAINTFGFILGILAVTLAITGIIKKVDKKKVILGFILGLMAMVLTLVVQGMTLKKMEAEENRASTGIETVLDTYRV